MSTTPLFSDLSPASLQRLIEKVGWVHLEPGAFVFEEGDAADALYVIAEGEVAVMAPGDPRHEVGRLGEGQFFGEVGLLSKRPRVASVRATAATDLLVIDPAAVSYLVDHEPGVMQLMLRFVRDRLVDSLVETSPIFAPFATGEREALVESFQFLEIAEGSLLIHEGGKVDGLYILLSGEALVEKQEGAGQTELARLKGGDIFGEMSILNNAPAVAGVRAASKCFALMIADAEFRRLIMMHPQVLEYVSSVAQERSGGASFTHGPHESYSDWHVDLL